VKTRLWATLEPFRKVMFTRTEAGTVVSTGSKASISPGALEIVTVATDAVEIDVPEGRSRRARRRQLILSLF
jgi:hypothetical protein